MITVGIKEHNCPVCYHALNSMSGSNGRSPKAGDHSVCIYCGAILYVGDDLLSVEMDQDQLNTLQFLFPETWEELSRMKMEIRDNFPGHMGSA